MRPGTAPPDATQERHAHACEALHERDGVARVSGGGWKCSSLMSRAWLNLGATSSSSSAARAYGWLTAPHESQAHGSPVCNGASNETRAREWLAALSETPGRSRAGDMAAGNETSTRSWLQPVASAQPTTNSSTAPMGKRRAWMEPSAIVEPQAKRQKWMAAIDLGLGWSPLRFWTPRSNANACQEPESSVQRAQCGTCI